MNIDISNAHCGPRIQFPDHAWLRVVYVPKDCLRVREIFARCGGVFKIPARTSDSWTFAKERETFLSVSPARRLK